MTSKKFNLKIKDSKLYNYMKNFTVEVLKHFKVNISFETIPKIITKSYNPEFVYKNNRLHSFDEGEEDLLIFDYRVLVFEYTNFISNLESNHIIIEHLESKEILLNSISNILEAFIARFLMKNNSFGFNLEIFNDIYISFEKILFKLSNEVKTLAIIPGLDITSSCFKINDNISIRAFSKDLYNKVFSKTKEKNYLNMMLLASNGKSSFIEVTTHEIIQSDFLSINMNHVDLIRNLVLYLRLFKQGDICIINYIPESDNLITSGGGTMTIGNRIPFSSIKKQYIFNKSDLKEFQAFYKEFIAVLDNFPNYISLAISRYNDIWFRKKVEDIIVDLIIAFESLFLSNNPEISFRLAFSVAHFIGKSTQERKEIYTTMKDAYDVRSKIVHGSSSRSKSKVIGKLPDIISKLQDYFRITIRKIVIDKSYLLDKNKFLKYIEGIILS